MISGYDRYATGDYGDRQFQFTEEWDSGDLDFCPPEGDCPRCHSISCLCTGKERQRAAYENHLKEKQAKKERR